MSDPVSLELIQVMLQRIIDGQRKQDGELAGIRGDLIEIKERLGFIEGQYANLSRRSDRTAGDIEQIRKRLGLVEA